MEGVDYGQVPVDAHDGYEEDIAVETNEVNWADDFTQCISKSPLAHNGVLNQEGQGEYQEEVRDSHIQQIHITHGLDFHEDCQNPKNQSISHEASHKQ